jgi:pimeloyl-ACP methyl ester carboxylesterase
MASGADGPLGQGEHTLTVDGVRLGYEVRGQGPVLLVHSGGPGIDAGYLRMPELEGQLTMVYLDPVGTGRSDLLPGGRYTVAAYAAFVERTIQHLGLTRPYFLGHSHGGFVGLELAIRRPGLLGGLILYSSAPVNNAELVEEANRRMKLFADRWPDRPEAQHAAAVWAANRTGTIKQPKDQEEFLAFFQAILPAYFKDYRATVAARGPQRLDGVHDPVRTGSSWDVRSELATIDLPTLVVSGRYDFICSPRWGDELAVGISGARHLKLDDVGHFAHLEGQRDEFFSAVATFAARAPTSPERLK